MSLVIKIVKNGVALLLGFIFTFFLIEGVLRVYNPFDFRVKGDKIVLPINKKYVIKKKSSQSRPSKFDETIIHTKNSLGFRGAEPPVDISEYLRIITVGGSTTECTFLSDGKTWTDILGSQLQRHFKKLWINNAGFDGHSTFGHNVLMEDYIIKLKPHIVLFLVGANDQERQDLGEQDMEMMRKKYAFHSFKVFLKSMATRSEVISMGLNFYRYWKSVKIGVEHNELDFAIYKNVDINDYQTPEYMDRKETLLQRNKSQFAEQFGARLQTLIDIAVENNIEPVLVTQPAFYGDFIDEVTNVDFKFTKISWELLEIYNDVTREVARKNNILVIDLAGHMPKSSKYYYDWLHYSNEGAKKVAEIIYNILYVHLEKSYAEYVK